MGDLHYPDLRIQGFRGIKDLEVPQLGRVTLITGKNNTGKTSILEAVRLHVQNAVPPAVLSILSSREEYLGGVDERERTPDAEDIFPVLALFHGFPDISESLEPVIVSTHSKIWPMSLAMRVDFFREVRDSQGMWRLDESEAISSTDPLGIPGLVVETEGSRRVHRLTSFLGTGSLALRLRSWEREARSTPCVFVSPYSGERTDTLLRLWDAVALTEFEKDIVEALRIIDPNISAVNMLAGEGQFGHRTAKVRAKNITRPVPLRSFGDGMSRLFAMILSLVNAQDGLLLIDEFENGLHHSVQLDAWRLIFRMAQELDVQVFATSHSWDAVETFQKAAAEAPDDGVLLRLTRRYDKIFATVFAERELAVATRHNIEVR